MSGRTKWIAAVVALVVLAAIGLVAKKQSSDEPIAKPRVEIGSAPVAAPSRPTAQPTPHAPTPTLGSGSARSDDMRNGITGERGVLATLPAAFELTKAASGHMAVNLAGGASGAYGGSLHLPGTHAMSGRVIDRAGNPVAGAVVLVDSEAQFRVWAGSLLAESGATTGADGSFALADGPPTGFAFAMQVTGGWSKVTPIGDAPVTLQLLGHGALHGTLRYNKHGEAFSLQLNPVDPALPQVSYETDADGTFTIASLAPGAYKLRAGLAQTNAGGASKYVERDVVIDPDRTAEIAIDQEAGTTIAIAATPAPQMMLEYWLFTGAAPADLATAKARGKAEHAPWYLLGGKDKINDAEFHDISPGSYSVCAAADREVAFGCAPVVVSAGDPVREVQLTLVPVAKPDATR